MSPIEGWIWRRWGYAKVIGVLEMPRIIKAARGSGEEGVREGEEEYCLLYFLLFFFVLVVIIIIFFLLLLFQFFF